jgi:hypothetical protein
MSTDIRPWIGVDLDGTLAFHEPGRFNFEHVGDPIPLMAERVKKWLTQGLQVKIFTARVCDPKTAPLARIVIKRWLATHGFPDLEVTCTKDFAMVELWDDRAIGVVANTGIVNTYGKD